MLSVGVFIDLYLRPGAGGHVKTWQRLAHAAAAADERLDLTVHFLGESDRCIQLAENVRYRTHEAVFSTRRLSFLGDVVDHTDLALLNRPLLRDLPPYDVIHTTHALFTLGRTARAHAHSHGVPLVNSIHTDVPAYTEIYGTAILRRLFGEGFLGRLVIDELRLPVRRGRGMERRLKEHWRRCAHVLVSQAADFARVSAHIPETRVSYLRRGVDKCRFGPELGDRAKLNARFGLPCDRVLLLFAGRVDPTKRVMVFAEAVHRLVRDGVAVHALVVGEGSQVGAVRNTLRETVTLTGVLPQEELAWIYASCDLFVFPSTAETYGNVVVEAMASGLPVVVANTGGAPERVRDGVDGVVVKSADPDEWARALQGLIDDPDARERMGRAGALRVQDVWPTWTDVLQGDLTPIWTRVARSTEADGGPR